MEEAATVLNKDNAAHQVNGTGYQAAPTLVADDACGRSFDICIDDLCGVQHFFRCDDSDIIIGRAGTVQVGTDDGHLHRVVLQAGCIDGQWIIRNTGEWIPVVIENADSPERMHIELSPGAQAVLPPWPVSVTFSTRNCLYELYIQVMSDLSRGLTRPWLGNEEDTDGGLVFTPKQMELFDALVRPVPDRRGSSLEDVPSTKELLEVKGWNEKEFSGPRQYAKRGAKHMDKRLTCALYALNRWGTTLPRHG